MTNDFKYNTDAAYTFEGGVFSPIIEDAIEWDEDGEPTAYIYVTKWTDPDAEIWCYVSHDEACNCCDGMTEDDFEAWYNDYNNNR